MVLNSRLWRTVTFALLTTSIGFVPTAHAEPDSVPRGVGDIVKIPGPVTTQRDSGPFTVTLEATTIMPYMVGGAISLVGPGGLLAKTTIGGTPIGLITLAREIIGNRSLYNSDLADGLLDRVDTPLVWRLDLGWKPAVLRGFYISAGYGFIRLGAQVQARDLPDTLNLAMPGLSDDGSANLSATVHMVNAEIGWEIGLGSHWVLRLAAGASFTFDVAAVVNLNGVNAGSVDQAAEDAAKAENMITDTLQRYGRVPTFSVAIGYRAF